MKGSVLTLSVFLAFIREQEGKLKVSLLPRFPVVYVGDYVNLVCTGANKPITWFINGSQVPHNEFFMRLTDVTPKDNGNYACDHNGQKSDAYTLTVLTLEAPAQLSPTAGGSVIFSGEDKLLTLRVDDELEDWKCFVFRNGTGFKLELNINSNQKTASVYAGVQEIEIATFWCLHHKTKDRSNSVTLRMTKRLVLLEPPAAPVLMGDSVTLRCAVWGGAELEEAVFYRQTDIISTQNDGKYTIENASQSNDGQYKCNATYRYSHASPAAVRQTVGSDPQTLKVIAGPPAAHLSVSGQMLNCSCPQRPDCSTYHWYQTDESNKRTRLSETSQHLHREEAGVYSCRAKCEDGFSRFSNKLNHRGGASSQGGIVAALLIVFGLLIVVFVAVKFRQRRRNRARAIEQGKGDRKKDTGGDYEQIGLTNKAIYHTLGEATDQAKAGGGYEALKRTEEEKGVYHTLGEATDQAKAGGGYEALKKTEMGVYHTLDQSKGESQGQAGYEALQNVKVQVYQTLSSEESKKLEGEAEGGYEKLPQKTEDYQDIEENPYEELKAEKPEKKK